MRPQEDGEIKVDVDAESILLEADPVKTELTFGPLDAGAVNHDVVTVFHVAIVVARPGDQDVIALMRRLARFGGCAVIALPEVFTTAQVFHPVVAPATTLVTEMNAVENIVIAFTSEHFTEFAAVNHEVVAFVTEDHVLFVTTVNGIITGTTLNDVRAGEIRQDIVARATRDEVGAIATLDAVVTPATPEGIITDTADDRIVTLCTTDDGMIAARILNNAAGIGNRDIRGHQGGIADHEVEEGLFTLGISSLIVMNRRCSLSVGKSLLS